MTEIRTLSAEQARLALDWAREEGWNPGVNDLACFLAQDRGLFLGGFVDGKMASVISATRYEGNFGFIGFYIARPDARGQGHGMAVWRAAMTQLQGRLIGLDGVVAQQENYRKSGFELAWRNIRFGGTPKLPAARGQIVPAASLPLTTIGDLDAQVFPVRRPFFLHAWIGIAGHVALALLRDGRPAGFGVIRPCAWGHKIGPLVAEDAAGAEALAAALLARVPPGEVFLDVPEPHKVAVKLAQSLGLAPVFETARMYTGPAPAIRMDRLFGVASFELG